MLAPHETPNISTAVLKLRPSTLSPPFVLNTTGDNIIKFDYLIPSVDEVELDSFLS